MDRVQWFRVRAQMERWEEEVEIVEEEFRRTVRAYEATGRMWSELGEKSRTKGKGYVAYALQKASMFEEMATDAREKFEAAGGSWPTVSLVGHIYAQQESR